MFYFEAQVWVDWSAGGALSELWTQPSSMPEIRAKTANSLYLGWKFGLKSPRQCPPSPLQKFEELQSELLWFPTHSIGTGFRSWWKQTLMTWKSPEFVSHRIHPSRLKFSQYLPARQMKLWFLFSCAKSWNKECQKQVALSKKTHRIPAQTCLRQTSCASPVAFVQPLYN